MIRLHGIDAEYYQVKDIIAELQKCDPEAVAVNSQEKPWCGEDFWDFGNRVLLSDFYIVKRRETPMSQER